MRRMQITLRFTVQSVDGLVPEAIMQLMIKIINLITGAGGSSINISMDNHD